MRILMLNNEFPTLGGGTGTVNHALLLHLAQVKRIQIDLITSALGRQREEEQFAERIRIFKVPVNNQNIHHSSNRELLTYAARALHLALRRHRVHPYDICFAWSAVPAGGVALALRKFARLCYIVRVCGPDIPGFEKRYRWLYPILTPLIRGIWHGAERVVAKCESEANMIRKIDHHIRIDLISNGVDLDVFLPGEPIPDDGPLRLLCVARLIERKGQRHLIEAVKRLTDEGVDVCLELVGTGDALSDYQNLAQRMGVPERVHFMGFVPHGEIAKRYALAHVFVLPSYNEGMSVATLEAMAAGLPVVVTRTGGTAELVEEGRNGFTFAWSDVDSLTVHLRRLTSDRVLARRMGAASNVRAAGFSWNVAAERYMELFEQIAARIFKHIEKPRLVDHAL